MLITAKKIFLIDKLLRGRCGGGATAEGVGGKGEAFAAEGETSPFYCIFLTANFSFVFLLF
jgi:hypothetical protein